MAKKQVFGEEAKSLRESQRKMAKVIIATKNERGKYAYKETMMDQDKVTDFISKHKAWSRLSLFRRDFWKVSLLSVKPFFVLWNNCMIKAYIPKDIYFLDSYRAESFNLQ